MSLARLTEVEERIRVISLSDKGSQNSFCSPSSLVIHLEKPQRIIIIAEYMRKNAIDSERIDKAARIRPIYI